MVFLLAISQTALRPGHGLACNDAGGLDLGTGVLALAVVEGGTSIKGLADTSHHTSEELLSDGHVGNNSGTKDDVSH